jgi:hypothetical protein
MWSFSDIIVLIEEFFPIIYDIFNNILNAFKESGNIAIIKYNKKASIIQH